MLSMLNGWGEAGLLARIHRLQQHYRQRRDVFQKAVEANLGPELVEWKAPGAGMFAWLKVNSAAALPLPSC